MSTKRSWQAGDPYCGTALEALNFALDNLTALDWNSIDCMEFLAAWREGDLANYPEFTFEPKPDRISKIAEAICSSLNAQNLRLGHTPLAMLITLREFTKMAEAVMEKLP